MTATQICDNNGCKKKIKSLIIITKNKCSKCEKIYCKKCKSDSNIECCNLVNIANQEKLELELNSAKVSDNRLINKI